MTPRATPRIEMTVIIVTNASDLFDQRYRNAIFFEKRKLGTA
jgi:hypothetical protein